MLTNTTEANGKHRSCELQLDGWNILNISSLFYFEKTSWLVFSYMKLFSSRWLFLEFSCSFVNDFLSASMNLTSLSPSLAACEQSLFYLLLLHLLFHGKSLFSVQSICTVRKGFACRVHLRQSHVTVQWREMTSSIPSKRPDFADEG